MPLLNSKINFKIKLYSLILANLVIVQLSHAQIETSINAEDQAIPVSVKLLSEVLIDRKLQVPAETVSVNTSQLSSEIIGIVKEISTEVGQQIKKDEILLKLDSTDYELAYQLVQTNLVSNAAKIEQAQLRLQRANDLNKSNYIAADDLLARQTDLNVLKAERLNLKVSSQQAQRNLDKTIIKAPFAGIVAERFAHVGSYVSPGVALIKVIQSNNAEIYADVPMQLASSLNQAISMTFKTGNNYYPVQLLLLSPVIQQGMRTQKARFSFKNQQAAIGSSGELEWVVSEGLLPADLVVNRNRQLGVFTVVNDKASFIPLSNAQEGRPVVINLDENTTIIVGGRERLQDGDSVKVK